MMIKSSLLLCVGLVSANLSFSQKAIVEKADLKNVTVFTNAAELSHTANINIPSGNSEIVFTHVANSIDENSIQIGTGANRSEEHTSELQSRENLVCRLLLEKKKNTKS